MTYRMQRGIGTINSGDNIKIRFEIPISVPIQTPENQLAAMLKFIGDNKLIPTI